MVNEHIVNYHPSPSELISKDTPSETCIYHHGCGKFSNSYCWDYWKIHLWVKQNWICSFLLIPPGKTLSQVFIITTPAEGIYPFCPSNVLWKSMFPEQKGGRIMELKKWPKFNLRENWWCMMKCECSLT